ncbi:hypothetical protein HDU86_001042 [Geranomyces michiganensis]|nr:hypothetical protein HDU86_001042 [Geranomyces michiganensis]
MLKLSPALLFVLVASVTTAAIAAPASLDTYDCKNIPGHGRTFNLEGPDFSVDLEQKKSVSTKRTTVWGNACAPLTAETLGKLPAERKENCAAGTWFCEVEQHITNNQSLVTDVNTLAKAEPEVRLRDAEVDLLFVNGERSVNVSFQCGAGLPVASWEPSANPNVVTIIYKTQNACAAGSIPSPTPPPIEKGSGESMSGWGVLWMLLFVGSLAYCVIGSAYNYSVFRVRSFPDILPHWPIWSVLLAQTWDLVATLWERLTSRGRNYVHL